MEVIDIIIIAITVAAAIWGLFKGFISQIVSIISIILGIWCASKFTGLLTAQVQGWFNLNIAQNTLHIILFAVIFIAVLILAHFIGKGVEKLVQISLLGWANRLLGLLLGAAKAIIIMGIAVSAINYLDGKFDFIPDNFLKASKGYAFLEHFSKEFFPFMHKLFS